MANMCANQLFFSGNAESVKNAIQCFTDMMHREHETNHGQIPPFAERVLEGYFFNTYTAEFDEQINFETRWSPNIKDVVLIAEHFGVEFDLTYQETSNSIFGKSLGILSNGKIEVLTYDLDATDLDQVHFIDDECYFKGEKHECESEVYEQIFENVFGLTY